MVTATLCAIILTFAAQSVVCHLIAPGPRGLGSIKPILSGKRGLHSKASCRSTAHRHLGSRMSDEGSRELDRGWAAAPGQARVGSPRRPPIPCAARTGRSRREVAPFDPSRPLAEVICWYHSAVRSMQDTEQERPVLVPHWRRGMVLLSCGAAAMTLTLQVLFTNRPQVHTHLGAQLPFSCLVSRLTSFPLPSLPADMPSAQFPMCSSGWMPKRSQAPSLLTSLLKSSRFMPGSCLWGWAPLLLGLLNRMVNGAEVLTQQRATASATRREEPATLPLCVMSH